MRPIIVGAVLALLCSCSDGLSSLKAEAAALVEELRSESPSIPALRPAPEYRYQAGRLPDPFYPDRR